MDRWRGGTPFPPPLPLLGAAPKLLLRLRIGLVPAHQPERGVFYPRRLRTRHIPLEHLGEDLDRLTPHVQAPRIERAERNRLYVTAAIDDLIGAIGWKPRSTLERETMRRRVWRWLAMFDAAQVIGRRPGKYRDPDSKEVIDLTSIDALIRITGQRKPAQLAFDASVPPIEVTYAAGPWIEKWRGNRQILTYFAVDVRKLAAIPAGKPSGAWAQAIGLALHQRWRERSAYSEIHHVGEDRSLTVNFGTFTRRELLDLFPPDPSVDEVLNGPNPRYAKDYWHDAIQLLKYKGIVSYYKEFGALPDKRQGWQQAWLDQKIDIRPSEEGKRAPASPVVAPEPSARRVAGRRTGSLRRPRQRRRPRTGHRAGHARHDSWRRAAPRPAHRARRAGSRQDRLRTAGGCDVRVSSAVRQLRDAPA
jgi:hypothetical protein